MNGPGMGYGNQGYQQGGRGPGDQYPPPPAVMSPAQAIPPQQGGGKKKVFAIVGGVLGVALLAAVLTVLLVHKGPEEPTGPVAIGGTSTAATGPTATPTPTTPTPTPPPDPTADSTGEPAGSAEPPPSAEPDKPAAPTPVAVTIVCKPGCDTVRIDGKNIDQSKPVELLPGNHSLEAAKIGYLARVDKFVVKADEPMEKVIELSPAPKSTGGTRPPPCTPGQFIKKCK
jgi:hypothetical protein